ncbi:MAG: glutamate synthase subunit alpha, partial [Deltaproteobacteria bacterium]
RTETGAERQRSPSLGAGRVAADEAETAPPRDALDPATFVLYGWDAGRLRAAQAMAREGKEPLSSMGYDRPLPVFSAAHPPLTKYFRQIIAVVTNPPIDPIREGGAMDLSVHLGRPPRIDESLPEYAIAPQYRAKSPLFGTRAWTRLLEGGAGVPRAEHMDATYDPAGGPRGLAGRIAELKREALRVVRQERADILVLSDRRAALRRGGPERRLPIPILLLLGAIDEALVEAGLRRHTSLVVESGEVQEAHDAAVYIACGADAVHPWLFLRACRATPRLDPEEGERQGLAALDAGLARILSKMGITTLDGYRGSKLFEAVGVSAAVVDYYLPGITSRLGGIDLEDLHQDALERAERAADPALSHLPGSPDTPVYRKEVYHALQLAAHGGDAEAYARFVACVEEGPPVYLRDLLELRPPPEDFPAAVALGEEEVAPPEWIIATTFRGAAMSHGALHRTAHRAIAAAFNRFGSRSNSGEGGEDPRRDRGGPWAADRSRIRQVASGRFGVEARYLVHADELEIKIGQGAKPGEGGHLPAHKVTVEIARIRRTQPGVALISPPPHHDIYSIEDLAQLIYDLRQVNPRALIGVKCPAVTDIGTIAVGVVKAGADILTISGAEGGTGAAAASSIEHAGLPVERGLAETHQALVLSGVRGAVVLRCDGGIKTGSDVVKLLALGADEVALGTALMIAEQCVYCHGCAKGRCPAGITTQDEEVARRLMRPKAKGPVLALAPVEDPDGDEARRYEDARRAVERYLLALATDVRRHLARLGVRTPGELVGRVDLLGQVPTGDPRIDKVDLSDLIVDVRPQAPAAEALSRPPGEREAPSAFDRGLLEEVRARLAAEEGEADEADDEGQEGKEGEAQAPVVLRRRIASTDRAALAALAGEVASGRLALPPGGLRIELCGVAGQALGFALVEGLSVVLEGLANDTVGEAMSGGQVVVRRPPWLRRARDGRTAADSVAGNAVGYGMTGGALFVEGRCGQRLGVRMSGGVLVCEGAGKYAFEYMTGGVGVVLGPVSAQVCSGMTGGEVFLYDPRGEAAASLNPGARGVPLGDGAARARLEAVLRRYLRCTESPVAQAILEAAERAPFLHVVPA